MGYLAEVLAVARKMRPEGPMPVDLWHETTLIEWLVSAPSHGPTSAGI